VARLTLLHRLLAYQRQLLARLPWLGQFISFGCVGVVGLVADTAVLWLLLHFAGFDPYSAKAVSYLAAATVTWALNRHFTFKGQGSGGLLRQWGKFLLANLAGAAANYLTYVVCINTVAVMQDYNILANIPASLAGLAFNFIASKKLVFR
jgi:putative flippase GtrA